MKTEWSHFENDESLPEVCRAASIGDLQEVRKLFARGESIDSTDMFGCSPLMIASRKGYLELVQMLLDLGAAIDGPVDSDEVHMTPLMHATEAGHLDVMLELLNRGANVNRSGIYTPLHLAIIRNNFAAAQLLLNHGASPLVPIRAGASAGRTSVEEAALTGSVALFALILKSSNLCERDRLGDLTAIEWLRRNIADVNKIKVMDEYFTHLG